MSRFFHRVGIGMRSLLRPALTEETQRDTEYLGYEAYCSINAESLKKAPGKRSPKAK